ncbi:hypothetical protein BUALT_Bualt18G0123600 [Buddleja alternifolia]|uniref:MADS-box domain-containing protein n=1 Tax=Buddleja alternifolia TaxID=168488 RepID=A0AAV6W4Z6_9LAMI|nr:hypothetical protein BUALT_Bualt18G0123600 [Buddleja alternifolia]
MDNNNGSKKTIGRSKIEIKKIAKKTSLQVTFTKRRMGLFRKASELSLLCGAQIAILVESPAKKVFAFGSPSAEAVLRHFDTGVTFSSHFPATLHRSKYDEAVRKLEGEKMMESRVKGKVNENWWDEPVVGMELHELEEYLEALEGLRGNFLHRVEAMERMKKAASSSNSLTLPKSEGVELEYHHNDGFPIQFNDDDFNEGENSLEVVMEEALAQMEKENASGSITSNLVMDHQTDYEGFEDFKPYFEYPTSFYNLESLLREI